MSSAALAAGVHSDQRFRLTIIAIFLVVASLVSSSGCGISNATTSATKTQVVSANLEIDAGVIFSDRSNYLCLPLSRFGISNSEIIETIVSSCECVKPSVVRYSDSSASTADGILIEFMADEPSANSAGQPIGLGIVVTCSMIGGATRTFTVNLLHTRTSSN